MGRTEVGLNKMFQWISLHGGIARNKVADRLAWNALELKATKKASKILRLLRDCHEVFLFFMADTSPAMYAGDEGLSRAKAFLLQHIGVGSACAPAWLHKIRLATTPLCPIYKIYGDMKHYLLKCNELKD